MKKSKVLQISNRFIDAEKERFHRKELEKQQKNRFLATVIVLVIFLFMLPTYNLVATHQKLKQNEAKLVELENQYKDLSREKELRDALVKKLQDEEYAAKYVRAKYQFSKDGEFIYNIPGLLPQ
ncbi:TPA: septum formation initiator family protein [Streptococcus suis]|nr:septum formation initiator family protein [Streptococcus suis]WNF83561.1 septum formation initiator family protein [Streptococcus suis]